MFKDYIATIVTENAINSQMQPNNIEDNDPVIAVMDRGWVFAGVVTKLENERIRLDCCYNIHKWGTSKGLGQLAVEGPTKDTILNKAGPIFGKPIFLMKIENIDLWK